MLQPLFKELVLQGQSTHQPFELIDPILESSFLCKFVAKPAPGVLLLPVIEQTGIDVITTAELGWPTPIVPSFRGSLQRVEIELDRVV